MLVTPSKRKPSRLNCRSSSGVGKKKVETSVCHSRSSGSPRRGDYRVHRRENIDMGCSRSGEPFVFVFDGVVNKVDDDGNTGLMRGVDELFELFGGSES